MNEALTSSAPGERPGERSDSFIDDDADFVKLFVGQIPKDMDEDLLLPFFSEFGPVAELTVIRDKINQTHKGCAFLTYCMQQSAHRAVDQLHDQIKLPNAINPLQVRIAESQAERENKLFIGMLPKTIDEEDLHNMFAPYGELREVHIIRGPEGSSKGCAFVKFVDRDAAMVAIEDMNDIIPPGSTRPLVVKFADSKKQLKLKEEGGMSDSNTSDGSQSLGNSKIPDFWAKQFQLQQQPQQFMYSYAMPNGSSMQQQHILPVPLSMPYGSQGNSQQQQYLYMPQQQQQSPSGGGYSYEMNSSGHSDGADSHQSRYPSQQQPYGRQQQQQLHQSASAPRDLPQGQRGTWPPNGQRSDKLRHDISSSNSHIDHQQQDDINIPLDSNGEISSRSLSSNQRPPEGPPGANLFIYHLPRDLTDADLATLFAPFGNVISAKVFVDKKTSDSKGFGFVSYDALNSADAAISSMNGFQIGSKRLKVQHKRTGYDEDPPSSYGMSNNNHSNGGNNNMGMMSRGGSDRMQGGQGHGQARPQGSQGGQGFLQQQSRRDNYMSDHGQGQGDGGGGRFQMAQQYGQMQQMNQVAYMPVQLPVSSLDQNFQLHYPQSAAQHRSLQKLQPNYFLENIEDVDVKYRA